MVYQSAGQSLKFFAIKLGQYEDTRLTEPNLKKNFGGSQIGENQFWGHIYFLSISLR